MPLQSLGEWIREWMPHRCVCASLSPRIDILDLPWSGIYRVDSSYTPLKSNHHTPSKHNFKSNRSGYHLNRLSPLSSRSRCLGQFGCWNSLRRPIWQRLVPGAVFLRILNSVGGSPGKKKSDQRENYLQQVDLIVVTKAPSYTWPFSWIYSSRYNHTQRQVVQHQPPLPRTQINKAIQLRIWTTEFLSHLSHCSWSGLLPKLTVATQSYWIHFSPYS